MITGPELDLLQEVLAEDPTADVYLDVAHALLDQGETRKAALVLRRALESGVQDLDTARMLARAAGEIGDDRGLRVAAQALGEDVMRSEPVLARAYAIALDRAGDLDRAGELAHSLLNAHGPDAVLEGIVERTAAPMPDISIRATDPFFTVRRAESYLESGRPDLAVRAYRRILAAHPNDRTVHARLLRVRAMPRESRPWVDDLSEEYWVGRPVSAIAMPSPTLVPEPALSDEEVTVPGVPSRAFAPGWGRPVSGPQHGLEPDPSYDSDAMEATAIMRADQIGRGERPGPQSRLRPATSRPAEPPPVHGFDSFDDEEATTVMHMDDPVLKRAALRGRTRAAIVTAEEDGDEEATVMMADVDRRNMARAMPGIEDLRRAIAEDDLDDDADGESSEAQDADSIIEQARAIEQRAADRRRRSLFRK